MTQNNNADVIQVDGSHYTEMEIQPWAVMEAVLTPSEFRGFLKGNIIKYSMRAGKKDGALKDAEKARHYVQKLLEVSQMNSGSCIHYATEKYCGSKV